MADQKQDRVSQAREEALRQHNPGASRKQLLLWFGALILGGFLGWLGIQPLNDLFNFIATVFTRLFQFIAVPTIALAVITTLSALGGKKETGRIFAHAVTYTLLLAWIKGHGPEPEKALPATAGAAPGNGQGTSLPSPGGVHEHQP